MLAKRAAKWLDEESFLEKKQIVRFVFGGEPYVFRDGGSGHDFWLVDLSNEGRCALELGSRCASQYLTPA